MKILVLGAGVLGCNIANNFFRAGKDVRCLHAENGWRKSKITDCVLRISFLCVCRSAVFR